MIPPPPPPPLGGAGWSTSWRQTTTCTSTCPSCTSWSRPTRSPTSCWAASSAMPSPSRQGVCTLLFLLIDRLIISVVDPEWFFSGFGSYFSVGFGSNMNFSNILNINFTMFSRLVSVLSCLLRRDISLLGKFFIDKKEFIFFSGAFFREILKFYHFFRRVHSYCVDSFA